MARINELEPIFCEQIPGIKEEGKLYISEKFSVAIQFLSDCQHELAGQTVELPELTEE